MKDKYRDEESGDDSVPAGGAATGQPPLPGWLTSEDAASTDGVDLPDWLSADLPPVDETQHAADPLPWESAPEPQQMPWQTAETAADEISLFAPWPSPSSSKLLEPDVPAAESMPLVEAASEAVAPNVILENTAESTRETTSGESLNIAQCTIPESSPINASVEPPAAVAEALPALPRLRLTLEGPSTLSKGASGDYQAMIVNEGHSAVSAGINFRLTDGMTWGRTGRAYVKERQLASLEPGQSRTFLLRAKAERGGAGTIAGEIVVDGAIVGTATTNVIMTEPALSLRLSGPDQCLLSKDVEFLIELSNPGTATASDIDIACLAPDELEILSSGLPANVHVLGRKLNWTVAALAPGANVTLTVVLRALHPGEATVVVTARGAEDLHASAKCRTNCAWDTKASCGILDKLIAALDDETAAVSDAPLVAHGTSRAGRLSAPGERHLVFSLAGTDYAVPFQHVLEVARPSTVTPVPGVPDWLLGISNVRGDIVSMVDLRSLLGMENALRDDARRMIVVKSQDDQMTTAILVDRVRGIRSIDPVTVRQPRAAIDDPVAPYLRGVTEQEGRLLILLDLDQLLHSPQLRQFEMV